MSILPGLANKQKTATATITAEIIEYTKYQGRDAVIALNLANNQRMVMVQSKANSPEAELKRYKISTFSDPQGKTYIAPNDRGVVVFESVLEKKDGDSVVGEFGYMTPLYFGTQDETRTFGIFLSRPLPPAKEQKVARVEILLADKAIKAKSWEEFYRGMYHSYMHILATENAYKVNATSTPVIYLTENEHSLPHGIYINNIQIDNGTAYRRPDVQEFKEQLKNNETVLFIREQFRNNTLADISVDIVPALKVAVPEAVHQRPKYQNVINWHKGQFKVDVGGASAQFEEKEQIGFRNCVIGFWNGWVTEVKPSDFSQPRLNHYENSTAIKKGAASVAESRTSAASAAAVAAAAFDSAPAPVAASPSTNEKVASPEPTFQDHLNDVVGFGMPNEAPPPPDSAPPYLISDDQQQVEADFLFGEDSPEESDDHSSNMFLTMG